MANAQYCLVYDKPITSKGLLWNDLVSWWKEKSGCDDDQAERNLYFRLKASLGSKVEELLFLTYYREFMTQLGEKLPALVPQVYLHYDPKTLKELQGKRRIPRERMDFLMLFSDTKRIWQARKNMHEWYRKIENFACEVMRYIVLVGLNYPKLK